tara:strand:- start:1130 stop:2248 length:1119 start_codon:yes stop_codon:yes gene_type:complete
MVLKIRLSKSTLKTADKKAVLKVLDKEFLGMGENVLEFENNLSKYFGRPTICVVNATAAIHLSLYELGFKKGSEVLVPSITYLSTFQAIKAAGYEPIPCDVDEGNLIIDLKDAVKKLTSKTRVILPVHYAGGVGNLEKLYTFAKKFNLRVVEDAAHAFGTVYKQKKIGSFGDIACFSFDGIKNITSGEGGCISSDDKIFIERIKNSRLLGVIKDSDKRYKNNRSFNFKIQGLGWRYHMSNIMAALGNQQLKRINKISKKRRDLAKNYDELLKNTSKVKYLDHNYNNVVPHIYVVKINNLKNREALINFMKNKGVEIGYHYFPNHFFKFFNKNSAKLNNTEKIFPKLLSLPLHLDLNHKQQKYIVKNLLNYLN